MAHAKKGATSGEKQTSQIRDVDLHVPASGLVEITDLATLRRRGGAGEFSDTQRLRFEMIFCLTAGETFHEVDFTTYRIAAGDVLWIHPGQVHRWGRIYDIDGDVILFTPAAISHLDLVARILEASPPTYYAGAAGEGTALAMAFRSARQWIAQTNDLTPAAKTVINSSLLAALVTQLVASCAPGGSAPPVEPLMRALTRLIETDYALHRDVQHYAQTLGYSTRTLNRTTHRYAGLNVKAVIDQRVILEAKRLLAHGALSVSRVATELGFDDAANFSAYFRHRTNSTPGAFRSSIRGT